MKVSPHLTWKNIVEHPISLFLLLGIAFWSSFVWLVERAFDGSDDPWGIGVLIILVLFGGFFSKQGEKRVEGNPPYFSILVYGITFSYLPNLVRGIIAAFVFARIVSLQRGTGRWHLGTWAVASLVLPWLSSLQFFLGYPMRWMTTKMSALFLGMSGLNVQAKGLMLMWGPVDVWVDAPCSGVKMLWVGMFFAATLAFIFRLKNTATFALLAMGMVATLIGNVIRASAVFYLEAGIIKVPDFFHDLLGLLTFTIITGLVSALAFSLKSFDVVLARSQVRITLPFVLLLVIVSLSPLITSSTQKQHHAQNVTFPTQLEGQSLRPRPLSPRDIPYLKGFPGELRTFQTPTREILIRFVAKATRKLHSATDCYKGLGYEIEVLERNRTWARYRATKDRRSYIVEERIRDADGELYYDVGAWYWAAKLGLSEGPWWSEVRVTRETP